MDSQDELQQLLDSWTKEDLYKLLEALKIYGSHNVENIIEHIPTKPIDEVKQVINYYKQKALKHPMLASRKAKEKTSTIPLISWANLLNESLDFKELHTEIAAAIRLIAEFEDIPPSTCTEKIDFKKIYTSIANALEGRSLSIDRITASVLNHCLTETAKASKSFISSYDLQQVLDSVTIIDKEINVLPRPTQNNELANIRYLALQKSYNPLNLPEDVLKAKENTNANVVDFQ